MDSSADSLLRLKPSRQTKGEPTWEVGSLFVLPHEPEVWLFNCIYGFSLLIRVAQLASEVRV
jgi:hypothetical protein